MGITAARLKELKLIDGIVSEPLGGAHRNVDEMANLLKQRLLTDLNELHSLHTDELLKQRYQKLMSNGYC